jgi:hypothetical protein
VDLAGDVIGVDEPFGERAAPDARDPRSHRRRRRQRQGALPVVRDTEPQVSSA